MNLHGMVRAIIPVVNPDTNVVLKRSAGYTTQPNGKQVPAFDAPVDGPAQIQPMGKADVRHMDFLNITGVFRTVYLYGSWAAGVRGDKTGGDVLTFGGKDWRVVDVPETWPDWCRVSVVMQ